MKGQQLYLALFQDPLLEGSFVVCDVNGVIAKIKKREAEYHVWLYKDCRPFKTDKLLKALTFVENNYCRKKL